MKKFKRALLLLGILLVTGINSCQKDQRILPDNSSSSAVTSISLLSVKQKIEPQEMLTWFSANLAATSLQPVWNKAVQTIYNGNHVIEVPTSEDAAFFFTKVNGVLNVYAYKWLNTKQDSKTFTGNIIYYSFQDNTVNASVYSKSKLIKNGVFNPPFPNFSSSIQLNK